MTTMKRIVSILLCAVLLAGFLYTGKTEASAAAHYTGYGTVATVKTYGSCSGMQGMAVYGNYIYCLKQTDDSKAFIARVNKNDGTITYLTNAANSTHFFYNLYHGNGLAVATIDGKLTLFVATGGAGIGNYSLVRLELSGTTLTEVAHYRATENGSNSYLAGVQVMCVDDTNIHLLLKRGEDIFRASVAITPASSEMPITKWCTLDLTDVKINGVSKDLSSYVQQAVGYYDNKIFVPYSGDSANYDCSAIIVYDLEGASGTIKSDPDLSFFIQSSTYANFFEIESCGINPHDGLLYFATNRRKSSSDANHDGVHYITDYVYDPAQDDSTAPGNYRWEAVGDELVSSTAGGSTYNGTFMQLGKVSDGTIQNGRFSINQTIILKHSDPWVMEWKSKGWTNHAMMLSKHPISNLADNVYLYRRKNSDIISLGTNAGGQYDNYGIKLSDHAIDGSAEHVYRLTNKIAADGSNMVYLSVDGRELGPMNNHYIGGESQNATSDWLNGQDLEFSYMGTIGHYISGCKLSYLQVWGKGIPKQVDDPEIFRWETDSNGMTNVQTDALSDNVTTKLFGSCSGGKYTGYQAKLAKNVVLMHDRPWAVEWQSDSWGGSNLILAASPRTAAPHAPYIYRSGSSLVIGYYDGAKNNNYGIQLTDHGIDATAAHTYRLTNKVNADGSNMVYLSVDGKELGAMNHYIIGTVVQGTTSDWLNGKDFSFGYFGTEQHPLNNPFRYIQVWESGIPADHQPQDYRWEFGTDSASNITTDGYTANNLTLLAGSLSNGAFTNAYYRLEKSVVLRHDKQWSVSWQSEGTWKGSASGAMLLSATDIKNGHNELYLYRSGSDIIALGLRQDSVHKNYGVVLADHGIDPAAAHTYKLINKVAADGSNMVYLSVDDKELGPMNQYMPGGKPDGTTANWVSGKDFVIDYVGTPQFPLSSCSLDYLQINEGNLPTATVKFVNWDGTVLSSKTYFYGDTVTVPANPTRAADNANTYTFKGWDKTVTAVDGDVTYTATYTATARKYTVKFVNWDGTVISSKTYNYGATVTVPANPTRPADASYTYMFTGWDKSVTTVSGNATYTAKYASTAIKYTVKFVNWDGTVISSATYNYGATVTVPANPTRAADNNYTYTFKGWDPTVTTVTGNTTYTATYTATARKYTVKFVNWDGTVLSSKTYSYGATVTVPANPTRPDDAAGTYTFKGWDKTVKTVTGNATYTAVYTCAARSYTVQFVNYDGTVLSSKVYSYGATVAEPDITPTRPGNAIYTYTFAGWDRATEPVTCDTTYTAVYSEGYTQYTVKFVDHDGRVIASNTYHYGNSVTAPAAPTRAADQVGSYTFAGWDKPVAAVTGNATYTATYTVSYINYTVVFKNWDGTVLSTATYHYGDTVKAPANPTRASDSTYTYTFSGWSPSVSKVTGNATYTAVYTAQQTTVTPTIKLVKGSATFEDEVFFSIYSTITNAEDVVFVGLLVSDDDVVDENDTYIMDYDYTVSGSTYVVRSHGIPAKKLGELVYFKVFAKLSNGTYAYSRQYQYSPKVYAMDRLANSSDNNLKALCVAMLNYGAAAQTYFGYNTENLANAELTAEQKALVKAYDSTMVNAAGTVDSAKIGEFVNTKGYSSRKPAVSFEDAFSIFYHLTPKYAADNGLTAYYWSKATYNSVGVLTRENADGVLKVTENGGVYTAIYEGIAAKEIDEVVYVAGVYESNGTAYATGIMAYSLGAYCLDRVNNGSAEIKPLAQATAVYGYYAKQYFSNI